jgi:hypothetical protein
LPLDRESKSGGVGFVKGIKKPEDCRGQQAQNYSLPVSFVKSK